MSLHAYLENNKGSDEDFDKVDALLDQLSAKSKDKAALLELTKAILVLNQEIKSKSSVTPATNAEKTSTETETSATAKSNSNTASDESKSSNTRDSKPAESTSEKETTEAVTSTGNQENPAQ